MDSIDKRRQTYLKKYGGEAGYRAEMQRRQQLSMQNPNRQKGTMKGGFNYMDKEQLRELARKAANKRWHGNQ